MCTVQCVSCVINAVVFMMRLFTPTFNKTNGMRLSSSIFFFKCVLEFHRVIKQNEKMSESEKGEKEKDDKQRQCFFRFQSVNVLLCDIIRSYNVKLNCEELDEEKIHGHTTLSERKSLKEYVFR